jgi:hypothetical protein
MKSDEELKYRHFFNQAWAYSLDIQDKLMQPEARPAKLKRKSRKLDKPDKRH